MSELDQDQAGSTADEAHDNPGTLDDEIDLTPTPTEAEILKTMMRSFLKMFSIGRINHYSYRCHGGPTFYIASKSLDLIFVFSDRNC